MDFHEGHDNRYLRGDNHTINSYAADIEDHFISAQYRLNIGAYWFISVYRRAGRLIEINRNRIFSYSNDEKKKHINRKIDFHFKSG